MTAETADDNGDCKIVSGISTDVIRCYPASHLLEITPLPEEDSNLKDVRWVRIRDVMRILCGIIIDGVSMPSISRPSEFFKRYGALYPSADVTGGKSLMWVASSSYANCSGALPNDEEGSAISIPEGLARAVLDVAYEGFVSVSLEAPASSVRRQVYRRVAHHISGNARRLERRDEWKYRFID